MPKYRIYFNTNASSSVEVEADDIDAAVDLAYDELPSGVCAMCGGYGGGVGIDLGGDWEADLTVYEEDGVLIDTTKATR